MKDPAQPSRLNARLLLLILAILLFSTLDAIFTLLLLDTGSVEEWNTIMAGLIERDVRLFAGVKTTLTGAGVVLLAALVDRSVFRLVRVERIIEGVFVIYLALLIYHLSLVLRVTGAT